MLIDNVVLIQFLALCPFIGMTTDTGKAMGMGIATSFVMVLATVATWPLYHYVLAPLGLTFLQTLVFILVIASLVQLVEFYLKKSAPALYSSMGVYLALITTNCAILAVTLNCISKEYNFGIDVWYSPENQDCSCSQLLEGNTSAFRGCWSFVHGLWRICRID